MRGSPIYLGIDTGGTYTDGVLLQPETGEVLRSVKVLTTHHDLRLCIAAVLDQLAPDDPADIAQVSLSTTLATNAIAEGKRKPIALLLLGYDPALVHQFQFQHQFGTPHYFFIPGRHDIAGVEQEPLDEAELARVVRAVQDQVEAFAIVSYGPRNMSHEERAAAIVAAITPLPVIQGHHLSGELNSIWRATTASLNASLLTHVQAFLQAVQAMLAQRNIHCPVMMVKGDGSLVRAEMASQRPVEIIHSGPATSAIGGQFLAGVEAALVVDIGGTTTDLALVNQGQVQLQDTAVVGPYRLGFQTSHVRSFGLGGDSLIRFDHRQGLTLGPERVMPLSYLGHLYPDLRHDLLAEWKPKGLLYSDELEYCLLRHEPRYAVADPRVQEVIRLLRTGPKRQRWLQKQVGMSMPAIWRELFEQEIIDRSGFTPTDLLHVTGEYAPWGGEIAGLVAAAAAKLWDESVTAFVARVRQMMTRTIVTEIIQFLSAKPLSASAYDGQAHTLDRWLYEESLAPSDAYLGCRLFLKVPLVGIGAPAQAFLPAVAEALGTRLIVPAHYAVANAVGTVVGNVMAREVGEVFPCLEGAGVTGYYARVANEQERYAGFEEARAAARALLIGRVTERALAAGAGKVAVDCQEKVIWKDMLQLSAWAVGKPAGR
jgi:N-methylhydantoinase A/oxoprolinase/acetone carboxylase beta subunit